MSSSTASTSATASAAVGSSMISTGGSKEAARPIAMLWRWPPERFSTLSRVSGMPMPSLAEHLRGVLVHLALVEERKAEHARARLAAEQEIAGDVDRVAERQVLIDHLDPLGAARRRARRSGPAAVDLIGRRRERRRRTGPCSASTCRRRCRRRGPAPRRPAARG